MKTKVRSHVAKKDTNLPSLTQVFNNLSTLIPKLPTVNQGAPTKINNQLQWIRNSGTIYLQHSSNNR